MALLAFLLLFTFSSIGYSLILADSLTGKPIDAQLSYTPYDFSKFVQKNRLNPTSLEKKIEKNPPAPNEPFVITYPSEPCRVTIKTFEEVTCPATKPKLWDGIACNPRIVEFTTEVWEC